MKQKILFLLCDYYPLSAGEFFLDDEMKVIHNNFEKIYIILPNQSIDKLNRFIPENAEVVTYDNTYSLKHKIKSIPYLFSYVFIEEFFRAIFVNNVPIKTIFLKAIFMEIVRSNLIIENLNKLKTSCQIDSKNIIYYSYWNDYKAFALARIKLKNKGIYISRAHSSDIFKFRVNGNYMPFKRFILSNLDCTYSISDTGSKELKKYVNNFKSKIKTHRLGKNNERTPLFEKVGSKIIFCSCSHFNNIKRVHLIPKILKNLQLENIHWVHFGWGYAEYEDLVRKELEGCNFTYELMGATDNNKVLDYYNQNYVDLFVNLSTHEGIPVSIMEALSAGIPVLATNVGGTNEIVSNEIGCLIEKDFKIEKVVSKITNYLNKAESEKILFRQRAYNFWLENYNANNNYKKFFKDINNLK